MTHRYSERVSVDCSVMFAGENVVAEGRILDLSLPGCLLQSSKQMSAGQYIQLRLFLPDNQTPLHVTLAAIRWADGSRLGIEFMSEGDGKRLADVVNGFTEKIRKLGPLGEAEALSDVVVGEDDGAARLPAAAGQFAQGARCFVPRRDWCMRLDG